jgi:hypothetical protein
MAYREFVDSQGVGWRVWSTLPSAGTHLRGGFEHGWLTFESISQQSQSLRRLVPIPQEWETATDERLELMCRAADEVARSTRDVTRARSQQPAHRPFEPGTPENEAISPPE